MIERRRIDHIDLLQLGKTLLLLVRRQELLVNLTAMSRPSQAPLRTGYDRNKEVRDVTAHAIAAIQAAVCEAPKRGVAARLDLPAHRRTPEVTAEARPINHRIR